MVITQQPLTIHVFNGELCSLRTRVSLFHTAFAYAVDVELTMHRYLLDLEYIAVAIATEIAYVDRKAR